MAASYPGTIKTFSTKAPGEKIASSHINELQDEVVAVETQLIASKLATLSAAPAGRDGWIPVSATWTYASPTTINVPSGAAAIYKVGQGLKLKHNGAQKWFYITAVADTQLTITGGIDYPFTSSGSNTLSEISYTNTPGTAIGFPVWFTFVPTLTGWESTSVNVATFCISGKLVTIAYRIAGTSSSTVSSAKATLPVTCQAFQYIGSWGYGVKGGVPIANGGSWVISANGTEAIFFPSHLLTDNWGTTGNKDVQGVITYGAA